jgi:hypothetical protein
MNTASRPPAHAAAAPSDAGVPKSANARGVGGDSDGVDFRERLQPVRKGRDGHEHRAGEDEREDHDEAGRLLLGIVASRLLHMATRLVLIVPRSDTPTQASEPLAAATAAGER